MYLLLKLNEQMRELINYLKPENKLLNYEIFSSVEKSYSICFQLHPIQWLIKDKKA